MARDVIATNRYFVLGTAHPDGQPRVSPVYFNHHEHRSFYWVSSPDSQHSRNIAADPRVNAVVFDSSTPPPENRAVYLTGTAVEVPDADLDGRDPPGLRPGRQGRPRLHRRGARRRRRPPPLPPRRLHRRGPRPRRPPPLGPRHRHPAPGDVGVVPCSSGVRTAGDHPNCTGLPRRGGEGVVGEEGVEDVGDGAAGAGSGVRRPGVGVHLAEDGADAEADGAVLVGLVGVQREGRLLAEGVVDLVEPDPARRPGQGPAGAGAAAGGDQAGVAERAEGLADQRGLLARLAATRSEVSDG